MVLCPICGKKLHQGEKVWQCESRHSFDVARQGYVNLLPVTQKKSLHPGDTAQTVAARKRFLDGGYYLPIVEKLRELAGAPQKVLDAGCGEGYYLSQLSAQERWGIDISKDAVRYAAVREKNAHWLTATAAHLPFEDGSFDLVLSMFALTAAEEFARVLGEKGRFVQVLAGPHHLPGLKNIIYPELIEKPKDSHPTLPGFDLLHSETIRFSFSLDEAQTVQDLLSMTPHFWRISKEGAQALAQTEQLTDTAEVVFNVYGKR